MKYMHTLGGRPATYFLNEQICFAGRTKRTGVVPVDSLKQIRKEQKLSEAWRKKNNLTSCNFEMGWIAVNV